MDEIASDRRVSKMTIYRAVNHYFLRSERVGRSVRIRTSWYQAWVEQGAPTFEAAS